MSLPATEVEFDTTGSLHDPDQVTAALALVDQHQATDVLVCVHGWNNDMPVARGLFERLEAAVADRRAHTPAAADRRIVSIRVLWPSVRWADDDDLAGGGVGLADPVADLRALVDEVVAGEEPDIAARLQGLVADLETSPTARAAFLDLLRERLPDPRAGDEDPPPGPLVEGSADEVFAQAAAPDDLPATEERAGGALSLGPPGAGPADAADAAGGAAGFGLLDRMTRAARTLLNLTTYYTMKRRAGTVGVEGVVPLLGELADHSPDVRLHLVGHSFGARVVVTAAARHRVHAVALLQGAFSHHGLAADFDGKADGAFRGVLAPDLHLDGPMVVTHTTNDRAVGLAYAVASRLARQQASGIGGPDDIYGGIGCNGALRTPEVNPDQSRLLGLDEDYDLAAGRVHNLRADDHVSGHSDVTGPEVAHAILAAMLTA